MDAHTKAMIATFVFFLVWVVGAFVLFYREHSYYKKNPHMWERRKEGMISLSDNQRYWCYAMWPLMIVFFVLFCVLVLVARVFEYLTDRKYDRKYPNVVKLERVQFAGRSDVTLKKIDGLYMPARPMGYASIKNRIKCAWLVFTGKADALVWPGDQ